ncbi:MAG: helix-turn-helix transcriptional regulator [Desulfovibrio sp.]|uniref:helix-turn-helix domain-containing transcriptional regulator n=1 Tax=Desulfovibrio sp. TaxID=885 RepID=UPI001A73B1A0|nr:helix-turn-helix transcriptional regulator [Desulfovibrio sp.]
MKYTPYIRGYLDDSPETWCEFAARAGVSRAALYKFLSSKNAPRIDTLEKLLRAAGFSLVVTPATPTTPPGDAGAESEPAPQEAQDA